MIKDRIVRVRLAKRFHEQRPFNYVGKVTAFTENWVVMEAKGIMLARNQPNGVQVDAHRSAVMFPREAIDSIHVLPDTFDIKDIQVSTEGQQLILLVEGAQPSFLGELGEG